MKLDEIETLHDWRRGSRLVVLGLLFLSALQFLAFAIVTGTLGKTEDDNMIFAGSMLLAGIAFALGISFRKVGAPTWKHQVAVALIAAPAAISVLVR
jgi:hypothetical protein